jgi:hypothetical protein
VKKFRGCYQAAKSVGCKLIGFAPGFAPFGEENIKKSAKIYQKEKEVIYRERP